METNRRDFIKQAALVAGGLIVEPGFPMAQDLFSPDSRMVGIQMAAHSLYDEGIEPTLDFLKEHAAINTLMIYSHTYYGIDKKPHQVLAKDHGVEPQDLTKRKLPHVWVKHHETHFQKTILRHSQPDPTTEYTNKDIFKDILRPVRDRGMKVYARILEAGNNIALSSIKNFDQVGVVDVYGKKGIAPCWNNPQYQNWIYGTVEDIFNTYDIDGLQYGAERSGPLSNLLFKGETPTCFCEHCKARNRKMNIDPDRAMEGYRHLHDFLKKVEADQPHGHETPMTMIFRYLQRYPEMLAWNYQWFQADEEIQKEMYRRVKKIKPQATVGRHVDHQRSSWDIFYRAAVDYGEMADHTDFIKPILYHDIYGPRLRWWVIEQWQKRIFKGLSREQALEVFYTWLGYSKPAQVALNQLETMGMGPDYVYDETKRCVDAVQGKVPVIAGIGLDVPWHSPQGLQPFHSDPEKLQQAIFKAAQAGASGFLASREYDEMRHSSLRAFGSAIKQL